MIYLRNESAVGHDNIIWIKSDVASRSKIGQSPVLRDELKTKQELITVTNDMLYTVGYVITRSM